MLTTDFYGWMLLWNDCELKDLLEEKKLQVPEDEPLPGSDVPVPYFIVGDDAFALKTFLMNRSPMEEQEGT